MLSETIYKRSAITVLLLILIASFMFMEERYSMSRSVTVPRAEQGVLDLRSWNWEQDGTVFLNGEWGFDWQRLPHELSLEDTEQPPNSENYIKVPGSWNGLMLDGQPLPGDGYATYHLTLLLPENQRELALRIPPINTAFTCWANGHKIASAGEVGTSQERTIPQYAPQIAVAHPERARIDLVIEVANFDHEKGGIRQPIEFGAFQNIARSQGLAFSFDSLLIGSLFIMGLYHLGLYAARPKEKSMLFFGLFCLLFCLRISLLGEVMLIKVIPNFQWSLELSLEYISAMVCLPLFILFFSSCYPSESRRSINIIICMVAVVYTCVIILLPPLVFTKAMIVLQLIIASCIVYVVAIILRAFVRQREGSGIMLFSCLIFAVTIVNDMLYEQDLVRTTEKMSAFGLLLFIFAQSVLLSTKLSRAIVNEEKLSAELTLVNSGLSEKVEKRTYDLEQANETLKRTNDELHRLETSRSHLLSNISHDLGTPLTTIQCYLEAIMDGLVDSEEQKNSYMNLIHSKVISMDRLIEDLFQLSQLEARQVTFKMQVFSTDRLMELLFTRYVLDARSAGLQYTMTPHRFEAEQGFISTVEVDLERMHQVYSNLFFNAIKFTPEGGAIEVEMIDDGREMKVRFRDNGVGIRAEELPYIFDRFYTNNKERNIEGKGLGLSISKEIVEYHGGHIYVEHSVQQEGTIFCFTLPVKSS
ncbi:ATP-binding protein [Paenibacillus cremeus]|uniref:histidine kinase n=1 Tax=Paenibacillus cremeus TaxID=2163881 RepID=A0A559KE37_9BACL|nr:ATP-binding protein [Paenibacillus cremeus]TVY10395.1 histidine kinase [Paenibacillus cremeus]